MRQNDNLYLNIPYFPRTVNATGTYVNIILIVHEKNTPRIEGTVRDAFQKINLRFPFRLFVSDMETGDSLLMIL
jgi:hypothetical protein